IKLPKKPRRPAFLGTHTQEVGSRTVSTGTVSVLMLTLNGATTEWPGASHALIIFPSASRKRERCQHQQIQSHQKKRSMLSFSRIFLQIVEEIEAEVFRTNITFPARDNLAGVRSRQHTRNQQIANNLLRICGVEFIDHSKPHAHGQLRPGSLYRVASEKYHFQ